MNDLIKIDGVTNEFCDITIVESTNINNVMREAFPTDFNMFLLKFDKSKNQKLINQRKKLNILTLCMRNLFNLCHEFYGLERKYQCLPKFNHKMIHDLYSIIEILPKKYVIYEKFKLCFIPYNMDNVDFDIIKIKHQGIAYLEQKHYKEYKKIIDLLKEMLKGKTNMDFDKYIDVWAKELLEGVR